MTTSAPLPEEWDEAFTVARIACRTCMARRVVTCLEVTVPDGTMPGQVLEAICVVCACQPQARLLYTDTSPFEVLSTQRVPIVG